MSAPKTIRTLVPSSIDRYIAFGGDSTDEQDALMGERDKLLAHFPFSLMLELAFPEIDFTVRWCWKKFGPPNGECSQRYSEYRICTGDLPHSHTGKWATLWFIKTDYDFGFCEWYFAEQGDHHAFCEELPEFHWGEHYPK